MEHTSHSTPNGVGHEESEVKVSMLVWAAVALAIGTGLVLVLVVGIFRYFHHEYVAPAPSALEVQQQLPPEPHVEVNPWEQLITVKAHENHVLSSYAWVDQKAGTVRIPIDKAIDMLAAKGLPSHDYLNDMLTGKKPPMPPKTEAAPAKAQGSKNASQ